MKLILDKKKAIDSFKGEMMKIRMDLRSVQHALREDIDSLDSWLKFVNIAGMPLLIGFVALGAFSFGRFRNSKKA